MGKGNTHHSHSIAYSYPGRYVFALANLIKLSAMNINEGFVFYSLNPFHRIWQIFPPQNQHRKYCESIDETGTILSDVKGVVHLKKKIRSFWRVTRAFFLIKLKLCYLLNERSFRLIRPSGIV